MFKGLKISTNDLIHTIQGLTTGPAIGMGAVMKHKFPLHIHLSTLFIVITVIISSSIAMVGYKMSHDMLESSAADLTKRISREIVGEIRSIIAPANTTVELLSHDPITGAVDFQTRRERLEVMQEVLNDALGMTSVFIGYESGDFFFLRRIRNEEERIMFQAPENTRYILQSISKDEGRARGEYTYLSSGMEILRQDDRPDYAAGFDPRTRPWYQRGITSVWIVTTPPYLFFSNRKVGLTIAKRTRNGEGVVAVDILLETLGALLKLQKITPSSQLALVDAKGTVIAHEDLERLVTVPEDPDASPSLKHLDDFGISAMSGLADSISEVNHGSTLFRSVEADGKGWRVSIQQILLEGTEPLYLIMAVPDEELFATALKLRSTSIAITLLIIILSIPVIWMISRAISGSLRLLSREAESIRRFEFDRPIKLSSVITEVNSLSETMDGMKGTIRKFMDITHSVAAEENFEYLLSKLLHETLFAGGAQAGVLYLADNASLKPCAALTLDGKHQSPDLPVLPLSVLPEIISRALEKRQALNGQITPKELSASGLESLIRGVEAPCSVAVPLFNRRHELLGLMLLQRQTAIDEAQLAFITALSASASSSLEARELIRDQKALFEAFIRVIASAIDAKSPYTGGHSTRVSELTRMLARAACQDSSGPYRDFQLDENDWEAVHIASWLHDCGKVTTPEYVIDKATKLETIYDRIHEIRMRFEVLKRDAEIACLKDMAAGKPEAEARSRLKEELEQLDMDFAFVAGCNEGAEFMPPENAARIKAIAGRRWIRTLDDTIGISNDEKQRKSRGPAIPPPVEEPLLADKPEHLFERRTRNTIPRDNKLGIRMEAPELLYNKGEIYNLSVCRGTLSNEERYKINEHVTQTIAMLSGLPFPKHLRQVPEIAGGHHEKMDGTGYPKRLKKEDMSLVARMMAVADIFEALTAVDRPYKKAKTLSESIELMSLMKMNQHIDPDIFDLFLRSGIYREYAERFMKPEQIDAVDIRRYLVPETG